MRHGKWVVLMVLLVVAAPLALAGAKNGGLKAPAGGLFPGAQGFVKLKYDKTGVDVHLFEVQIRKLPAAIYVVYVAGTPVGEITIAEGGSAGKLKVNTKRGDGWTFGDPAGDDVKVYDVLDLGLVNPVLEGTVPDPKIKK